MSSVLAGVRDVIGVSVLSFFWIAWSVGGYNDSIARIVAGDVVALCSLVVGLVVRARRR